MFGMIVAGVDTRLSFGKGNFIITEVTGRGPASYESQTISTPGMDGAYITDRRTPPRELKVSFMLKSLSLKQLREDVNNLNNILNKQTPSPIEFTDEPYVYYGLLEGEASFDEILSNGRGEITILCPDPLKYDRERSEVMDSGSVRVQNNGTAPSSPRFEIDVTEATTHMDLISDNGQYMRLGWPEEGNQQIKPIFEKVVDDNCESLASWTTSTDIQDGYVEGQMIVDGDGFTPDNYGILQEPQNWQGPAVKRSIGQSLDDFLIDVEVEMLNTVDSWQTGLIELYALDANNNIIGRVAITDPFKSYPAIAGLFTVGDATGDRRYTVKPDKITDWNDYKGIIRLARSQVGGEKVIQPYFAIVSKDGTHTFVQNRADFIDYGNDYGAPITQVQVAIRAYPSIAIANMKVTHVDVYKVNTASSNEVPLLASPGDRIVIDHATEAIMRNGESIKREKDFGGEFFKLPPGYTTLYQYPADAFNTAIKWRPAYK